MPTKHLLFSLPLTLAICGIAQAQPDVNNAPKGENPPNWNLGGRAGIRNGADLRRYVPLTPEQLRQLKEQQAQIRTITLKQRLTALGFTDEALQTAIVTEYKTQDTAKTDLSAKWQKINQALRVNQTPATDMATMVKEFRDAVATEKARRTAATTALETQFQISQKPVLDALLMTLGITGDEAEFVGQITGNGLNQILTLPALGGAVNGGPAININPRLFTLPNNGAGVANGGQLLNPTMRILPPIQNDMTERMPNPAPRKENRAGIFF